MCTVRKIFRFQARGYTVLELLLVMSILAILLATAAAPLNNFFTRYSNELIGRQLFDLVSLGRGKAYGHRCTYTLCPLASDNNCGTDWTEGALLFMDRDGDGKRASGEQVERIMSRLSPGASLVWRSFGNKNYLQFRPDGITRNQSGNFAYCPPGGEAENGWIIILNGAGRPYYGRDNDGDGIVENGSGDNLDCTAAN